MEGSSLQQGGGPPDSISNSTKSEEKKFHLFVSKHKPIFTLQVSSAA